MYKYHSEITRFLRVMKCKVIIISSSFYYIGLQQALECLKPVQIVDLSSWSYHIVEKYQK